MYPKQFFKRSVAVQPIGYFRFRELVPDVLAESVVYWRCPLFSVSIYHLDDSDYAVLQLIEHYRYRGEERVRSHTYKMLIGIASRKFSDCVDWYLSRNLYLNKIYLSK